MAFRLRVPLGTHLRDGIEYRKCFLGSEAIVECYLKDTLAFIINSTDRNLALVIGRCLDAQNFIQDVTFSNCHLNDTSDLYQLHDAQESTFSVHQPLPTAAHGSAVSISHSVAKNGQNVAGLSDVPVGVFLLLSDCYSPTCSLDDLCYSVSCPRRLYQVQNVSNKFKMVVCTNIWSSSMEIQQLQQQQMDLELSLQQKKQEADLWWSNTVPKEVLESVSKEEERRQNAIYDIIKTEKNYVDELRIIQTLFAIPLRESNIIDTSRQDSFMRTVFCNSADILAVNSKLLAKLLARQKEAHVVEKVGDIFLSIAGELGVYVEYCGNREYSRNDIAMEKIQNPRFKEFLTKAISKSDARAETKHELDGYLHKPIARMGSYQLLLRAILEKTPADHPDKTLIPQAMKALEVVLGKMNAASGKTMTRMKLMQLNQQIVMGEHDLNLMAADRLMHYEGNLVLKRPTGDLSVTVFLFDHVLLMTRKFIDKKMDLASAKSIRYKIYKRVGDPISYEFIVPNADVKRIPPAIGRVRTEHSVRPQSMILSNPSIGPKATSPSISNSPPGSIHSGSTPSTPATTTVPISDLSAPENRFQFSIVVVGRDVGGMYTFQCETESARNIWRDSIAKVRRSRLERSAADAMVGREFVMAQRLVDSWSVGVLHGEAAAQTPTSVGHFEKAPQQTAATGTRFVGACDVKGRLVVATDVGLFVGPKGSTESPGEFGDQFVRMLDMEKISQIESVLEHGILLVLADKILYMLSLSIIESQTSETKRLKKIGDGINFFKVGWSNNRTLVCTVRAAQLSSTIKIFESIEFDTSKKKGLINFFSRGNEAMKEFYIPTEASSIHILKTKLCVGCTKGFEIVDLETLETQALLDPSDDTLDFVLTREDTKPISVFKIALADSFIEIRHIDTAQLAQVVHSANVRLLHADFAFVLGSTSHAPGVGGADERHSIFQLRLQDAAAVAGGTEDDDVLAGGGGGGGGGGGVGVPHGVSRSKFGSKNSANTRLSSKKEKTTGEASVEEAGEYDDDDAEAAAEPKSEASDTGHSNARVVVVDA
ncbi:RHO1 GDP-GTP exchange protein 2 [Entophlyctis luteolus]|nr:RHO1 GDP-GTP exchange protein 2 [Entophlyctis luteolus]